jgi:hypothetical protein
VSGRARDIRLKIERPAVSCATSKRSLVSSPAGYGGVTTMAHFGPTAESPFLPSRHLEGFCHRISRNSRRRGKLPLTLFHHACAPRWNIGKPTDVCSPRPTTQERGWRNRHRIWPNRRSHRRRSGGRYDYRRPQPLVHVQLCRHEAVACPNSPPTRKKEPANIGSIQRNRYADHARLGSI